MKLLYVWLVVIFIMGFIWGTMSPGEGKSVKNYQKLVRTEHWLVKKNPKLKRRLPEIREAINQINNQALEKGIPFELALSVAIHESGWFSLPNWRTKGAAGEIGWYQIMPSTGRWLGYSTNQLKYTKVNIKAGVQYLSDQKCSDIVKTLRRYNGGPRGHRNPATKTYANKVLLVYKSLTNSIGG
jgi:soluble lytic murein transglycosylase-like protein